MSSDIAALREENERLKSLVIKMGDRLVSQGEKFAVLAEKKIIKRRGQPTGDGSCLESSRGESP